MNVSLDSINKIADKYKFCDEERKLALCNAKMQYALWIYEYAPFRTNEIQQHALTHNSGWQNEESDDADIAAIQDINNYSFMIDLPLHDSICMASRVFPLFVQSYEHSYILNHDLFRYYGTEAEDSIRIDSALIAKDMTISHSNTPSLFILTSITRKYMDEDPIIDDAIKLKEVNVVARKDWEQAFAFSSRDITNAKMTYNILSPSYWLFERKRMLRMKKVKKIIDELSKDDAEREAIIKAYEEETGKKIE
jgi:hypothetical protein